MPNNAKNHRQTVTSLYQGFPARHRNAPGSAGRSQNLVCKSVRLPGPSHRGSTVSFMTLLHGLQGTTPTCDDIAHVGARNLGYQPFRTSGVVMVILADLFFSIPCSELKRVQSPPSRLLLLLPRPPIVTASMSKKTAPERLRARTGDPKALVPAAPHLLAACVRRIKWRWEWPENKHIITCIYLNIYGILRGCVCVT